MHRRYLSLQYESISLGLRTGVLGALYSLIYVRYSHTSLNFILAIMGVFIVSIIETMALTTTTLDRLKLGVIISLCAGVTTTLGSMAGAYPLWLSLGIIIFMWPVGLSGSAKALTGAIILFISNLFVIGSGLPAVPYQAILYGLFFAGGGLSLVFSGYIHFIFYKNKFDNKLNIRVDPDLTSHQPAPIFTFNSSNIKFAIKLSIAVCGANAIAGYLKLPQQYCAPMTALLILKADHDFAWERVRHRLFGTLFGSILAAILIFFIHDKLLLALLMLPIMFFIVVSLARHYGAYVFFLTSMITVLFNLIGSSGVLTTEERVFFTLLGIAPVIVVIYLSKLLAKYFNKTSS